MVKKVVLVLAILLNVLMGLSSSEVVIGLLWETKLIKDIIHLQRSLETMVNLSHNNTMLEFYNVTGLNSIQLEQLGVSVGTQIFLSAVSCYQSAVLHDISTRRGVSVLAIDTGCQYQDSPPTYLTFTSTPAGIGRVIADVVTYQDWKEIAILYDDASGHNFDELMDIIDESNATIRAFKLNEDEEMVSVLDSLIDTLPGPRRIVLLCEFNCQVQLMQEISIYDKHHPVQAQFEFEDQWLLAAESFHLPILERVVGKVDNMAVIIPNMPADKSIESRMEELFSYVLQSLPFVQGLDMSSHVQSTMFSPCPNASLVSGFSSLGVKMQLEGAFCSSCKSYDIVTIMYGKDTRYSDRVATWSSLGLNVQHAFYPNMNFGMNSRVLSITTNVWEPFVMEAYGSSLPYEGLSIELLLELARTSNFTYNLTLPPDGAWGGYNNGTWTGMVGQLQRKEVDMVVAPLAIQPLREKAMDFTDAYFSEYSTVLAKLPDADSEKWSLYISPFKWEVWLSIAGSIPVVGFVVWVVTCLTPYYTHYNEKTGLSRLDNSVFYMFGALFTQGGVHLPNAQSGRFVVGFWWMYCIVLVATYSGNLIAFLTVSISQLPFETLEELVNQENIKYGVMTQTAAFNEFQQSHDDVLQKAWKNMVEFSKEDPEVFGGDHATHIQKVLKGGYAYINDRTGFEVEMSKYCQIQMIRDTFIPIPYAVGFQKRSAYLRTFSREVGKVIEGGLINKWKARWWPRQSFCARGMVTEAKSVSLKDVQGAYYVMAILLLVAFLTLSIEAAWNALLQKKKQSEQAAKEAEQEAQQQEPTAEELRDLAIWGVSRQQTCTTAEEIGIRDIYTNKEPMVDMFGRSS